MEARSPTLVVSLGVLLIGTPIAAAPAGETPKYGGSLNFVIPADAPPSFDAHRETRTQPGLHPLGAAWRCAAV
jgi:peptide/nickel transport system substrate-binding protein